MNILYWNVCNAADNQEIINQTEALIKEHDIDVACLQEIPYTIQDVDGVTASVPISDLIGSDLGYQSSFQHTRTISKSKTPINGYGTAILSRSGIIDLDVQTLRDDRLSYMTPSPENRRVLMTLRTEADPELTIGVAHLSYSLPLKIGEKGKESESDELVRLLGRAVKKGRLIFGGDLNSPPGSSVDNKLEQINLKLISDRSKPTFRSRHAYSGYTTRNLDRVYVSRGVKAETIITDPAQSDHHPIIVTTL